VTSCQHRACLSRWPCAAAGCISCPGSALQATKDHVNLFIYDPAVPDPEGIINQGHGNATARAIQIYEGDRSINRLCWQCFRPSSPATEPAAGGASGTKADTEFRPVSAHRNALLMPLSELASDHQREALCVKGLGGASSVVWPCIAEWGWSRQRVIGLVRRRAGLPMMVGEISTLSRYG
jgi:hypothetical protein